MKYSLLYRCWTSNMPGSEGITPVYYRTTEEQTCCIQGQRQSNSSVTSEIPVHHKNHLQFWTGQHLSKQRQVSTSAVQELRRKKKNLSKDSSTCNSCTILKIKYFKLVCNSFVVFFFFTLTGPLPTETKSLYWDNIIHVTHALLPNSHYFPTLAKWLSVAQTKKWHIKTCMPLFFGQKRKILQIRLKEKIWWRSGKGWSAKWEFKLCRLIIKK